ncbi:polysaccharide deacetylase family protein [Aquabacterium sp. A7-Y]|uniref:polysaccharide deacetylase family protein n=1 Tax=Aquabacterium sp. A7-Y TaxID=1349605 RepID=UPI00223E7473|nr:polysaccharide deacetylase family protein [Aquabacterium sp. A7-Y]MCW7539775.1 polysaccharide deacetylase family protein [Aquabacterium sp. A7-Y]
MRLSFQARPWARRRVRRCLLSLLAAGTAALSGCASLSAGGGEVLGRNHRFVLYQPGPGETLRSVAARFLGDADRYWEIGDFNNVREASESQPLAIPLQTLNAVGVHADHYQTVPILCYHRFGTGGGKMAVSTANFAAQLDWLARNDYHVIRLEQLVAYLEGRQQLPKRSVVLTIDDGFESVHRHAWPLLRRYGFPATLFVYSDFIGGGEALDWDQLKELSDSGLIDIQAHSKTHRNLLDRLPGQSEVAYREMLKQEAQAPRELLERRLKTRVKHYAYPYGDANEAVLETLTRQRYELAVTVNPGGNAFFAQPLMLRRSMIYRDDDLEAFKAKLQLSQGVRRP